MPKLTLNISEKLVIAAKSEAALRRVSVSKLVSDYFLSLSTPPVCRDVEEELSPHTKRLLGCMAESKVSDKEYLDHLSEKHS